MASPGQVTPRAKRRRGENGKDVGTLELSATKARARTRARRWGDGGRAPATPGQGHPSPQRLHPEGCDPAPGHHGERWGCASAPMVRTRSRGARVPPPEPPHGGTYFSGVPTDEQQDPDVPSLLPPAASGPLHGPERPVKTRRTPEPTLVLELDGTLLCTSVLGGHPRGPTRTFTVAFQGEEYEVQLQLRPHAQRFLQSLSGSYEILVFTTAKQDFAKKVLEVLDPGRRLIRRCLSQRDCLCAHGCYWKDLALLRRDLARTVALDHAVQGLSSQAANWILVPRWQGDPGDEELLRLIPLLGQLCQAGDVRPEIRRCFPLRTLLPED